MTSKTPYSKPFSGKIIHSKRGEPITDISSEDFADQMQRHGVILYTNFATDPVRFGEFANKNSGRLILDPTRQTHHESVQRVLVGTGAIDLHSEHSNSPFAPDYLWFYCRSAADSQGQTTVANGNEIWNALKPETQQFFCQHKIVFERVFPEPFWKIFVWSMLEEKIALEDVTTEHLHHLFRDQPDAVITIEAENSIRLCYSRYAFNVFDKTTKFFVNSMMGPYAGQTLSIENLTAIAPHILKDVATVYTSQTEEIPWQNGDIAVVDNMRFMHGRRESSDMTRELFSILSFK
jgi:hypothetical protein